MKRKLLIIDDDVEKMALTKRTLEDHFQVSTYEDSIGSSNFARKVNPDIVLLDVNMPTINGDKLIALLKASIKKDVIFVFYSSEDESYLNQIAKIHKAKYITKDVVGDDLLHK